MTSSSPPLHNHNLCRSVALGQNTSLFDLPDEIIELILSKCPVKSAVRFKSVSKSWQCIISNPRFTRILQSKLSENQKSKIFIWAQSPCNDNFGLYLIRLEDGKLQRESELRQPFGMPLCSCNGLILLSENIDNKYKYVLWNPLIKKHITIPAFRSYIHDDDPWHHHLYFESLSDDYKIVFSFEKHYAVYSGKNGTWGRMKDLPWIGRSVYVDGCLYRMSEDYGEIICFDTRDGKLHKFRKPKEVKCRFSVELVAMSGRLCLLGYKYNDDVRGLELWVIEDNGSFDKFWRKLISTKKVKSNVPHVLRPICLTREDDVVLWTNRLGRDSSGNSVVYRKYFRYNSRENCRFQRIDDFDSTLMRACNHNRRRHFPYSENLYMPSSTQISASDPTKQNEAN